MAFVDPATGLPVIHPPNPFVGFGVGMPTPGTTTGAGVPPIVAPLPPMGLSDPNRYDPLSSAQTGIPVPQPAEPAAPAPIEPVAGEELGPALAQPAQRGGVVGWLQQPENRSALLQAAVILLQPLAPGQSVAGQFGQALGAGGAAKDRVILAQEERDRAAADQLLEERRVAAAELQAEAAMTSAEGGGKYGGYTAWQIYNMLRNDQKDWTSYVQKIRELSFDQDDPKWSDPVYLEQLRREYDTVRSFAPGGTPGAATPAEPAVPAGTTLNTAAAGATGAPPAGAIADLRRLHAAASGNPAEQQRLEQLFEKNFRIPAKTYLGA